MGAGPPVAAGGGLPLFFGGGEVGEVMAGWDWASTAVGPPATWSPLLQTLVRVLLTSRFPMWLGFGPDLTFFYNDAYRRDTLGVKHPSALGRPAWEVWEEIWADIGPRIDAVLRTGEATWDEALQLFLERSGYPEETYHTFSYSPVIETDGRIVGMLCVVTEETDRVVGERRMTTLRDLASELSGTRNELEVFEAVRSRLGRNPLDLPFTATYLLDDDGHTARLACTTGIEPGHPVAPSTIGVGAGSAPWPVDDLLRSGGPVTVEGLRGRFGELPTGAWEVPPDTALLVPLSRQGQARPGGFLVAGVNPFRPADAGFVGFVELLAGQIAAGTASARAYEAERRRAESLAELDRAKTEFFSNVSHEFRTPLTLILGPAEDSLNDDRDALPPVQAARLEVIRRNARRLRRLVNDMLDFARIEGGRLRAETVRVDLARLTRDIASSFAPAIERAGLAFTVDCPDLGRPVHVDPDMWEKIVLNLLSNSLKFTLRGGVAVSLRDGGERAELLVTDTGVGIAPDQLPLLFQRFHRAPRTEARSHEGTGIGLALVHELVRLHGGEVTAASREGEGATFTVAVPYGSEATAQGPGPRESSRQAYLDEALQWIPAPAEAAPAAAPDGRTPGTTVLVVDDNPDMRDYISRLLRPYWRVVTAPDGAAALDAARRARPDLVLTDVMMPRLDGFGLLDALRADPRTATVPVVFLSARAGEEAAVEGLDAGADDYLVKPFSALELLARVRSNLELAGLRNEDAVWRRVLVESLREGVAVVDAAGTVVEVNPAFEEILGFGADGLPYRPPYPWIPDRREDPDGWVRAADALGEALRNGTFQGVVPVRHRDGHPMVLEASVDSVTSDDERRYVITFRDISADLVAAEREAALAQLGIRLAEASHALEVREVGLTELHRMFGAERAVLLWRNNEATRVAATDGAGLDDLAPPVRRALEAAARGGRVVTVSGDGDADAAAVGGMAAPLAPGGDLGALGVEFGGPRQVSAEDRALFGVLSGYVGQALRRAQLLDDSQTVATAMQRAILGPSRVPPGVAVRYVPAVRPLEVGGDWYDAIELPGDRLGLVVGDCVGRGLGAATVMGQLRSACRALLLQTGEPAATLAALDGFAARIPGAVCTTVLVAVLDRGTSQLHFSRAGHPPAALVAADGTASLLWEAGALPLGVAPGLDRPEATVAVGPGDAVLLYTDGLVERRDEGLGTGLDRLLAVARAAPTAEDDLADAMMAGMLPAGGQRDDVALVVYRRPIVPPVFRASVPAGSSEIGPFRHALHDWLVDAGVGEPAATEITIAAGEACSNAAEHAYGFDPTERVEVTAAIEGDRVAVEVVDTGGWRQPGPGNVERGRGIEIIERLTDGVAIDAGPHGTAVRFTRGWRGA